VLFYYQYLLYNMNRYDEQMVTVYLESKRLLINAIIELTANDWTVEQYILPIIRYLEDNYAKRAWFRLPEEYIYGYERLLKVNAPKFSEIYNDIDAGIIAVNEFISENMSSAHQAAVQNLVENSKWLNRLRNKEMLKNIKATLKKKDKLTIIEVLRTGLPAPEKVKKIWEELSKGGLTYIKASNGRRIPIKTYANMIVRTETGIAQNSWFVNAAIEEWAPDLIRIEKTTACPICLPHRNEIFKRNWRQYIGQRHWEPLIHLYHQNCKWFHNEV